MKTPPFKFPADAITHLMAPPEMMDFEILRAIAAPSTTPGVHYVGIINEAARHWRFIKGPVPVHSNRVWQWLAKVNPHWLKASWAVQEGESRLATSPDDVLDSYAKASTAKGGSNS